MGTLTLVGILIELHTKFASVTHFEREVLPMLVPTRYTSPQRHATPRADPIEETFSHLCMVDEMRPREKPTGLIMPLAIEREV